MRVGGHRERYEAGRSSRRGQPRDRARPLRPLVHVRAHIRDRSRLLRHPRAPLRPPRDGHPVRRRPRLGSVVARSRPREPRVRLRRVPDHPLRPRRRWLPLPGPLSREPRPSKPRGPPLVPRLGHPGHDRTCDQGTLRGPRRSTRLSHQEARDDIEACIERRRDALADRPTPLDIGNQATRLHLLRSGISALGDVASLYCTGGESWLHLEICFGRMIPTTQKLLRRMRHGARVPTPGA